MREALEQMAEAGAVPGAAMEEESAATLEQRIEAVGVVTLETQSD